jgi:sugar phosphate isomerase/epimerase
MAKHLNRRHFVKLSAAAATTALVPAARAQYRYAHPGPKPWPFYAFDNGLTGIATPEAKCKLLKRLGYDGIECHLKPAELPQMLEELDQQQLKLFAVYTTPLLEDPLPDDWRDWVKLLKGRDTRIEMAIRSRRFKPSDSAGEKQAGALVKRVSDLCADTGPMVSIYPHANHWAERVDDGLRLIRQVQRKNVGTNFNLVHWQWVRQPRPLRDVLQEAMPHLLLVTLNGLKGPATSRQQIRPLDDSDYDLKSFLSVVRKVGYAGPIGLQCYGITDPPADHLKRSIEAWKALNAAT